MKYALPKTILMLVDWANTVPHLMEVGSVTCCSLLCTPQQCIRTSQGEWQYLLFLVELPVSASCTRWNLGREHLVSGCGYWRYKVTMAAPHKRETSNLQRK